MSNEFKKRARAVQRAYGCRYMSALKVAQATDSEARELAEKFGIGLEEDSVRAASGKLPEKDS